MINIKKFLIGIFYIIPTIMLTYLAYAELIVWHDDISLGLICLFGTLFLGLMSFTAFKQSFLNKQISIQNHSSNDLIVKDMLVQKRPANEDIYINKLPEKVNYCPFCGTKIIEQSKYCYHCGKQINA